MSAESNSTGPHDPHNAPKNPTPAPVRHAQVRVLTALCRGKTIPEAAAAEGINPSVVYSWMCCDPNFIAAIEQCGLPHQREFEERAAEFILNAVDEVVAAAQRGEPEAIAFITKWMEDKKRDDASQN